MPLTLITGPANSAKAGVVLRAFREELARASSGRVPEPVLVVPTAADVEPYQRELAASGAVFGGEVLTFGRLIADIGARTGYTARPLGRVARGRIVRAAVADASLGPLAVPATSPGFAPAAGRLFDELQRSLVTPERFTRAIRAWAAAAGSGGVPVDRDGPRRYADDLAALYRAYHARLARLGRVDAEGHTWGVLSALRADPGAWGGRAIYFYGFDDLTPAQLDAVETLVRAAGVEVTVAVAYEPGRAAFAGRAATVEGLRPLADRVQHQLERAEHYAEHSRAALHHLERGLFETPDRLEDPAGAVRLLEAGGERAEAELVGAEVLELLRGGVAAGDVAVLVRAAESAPLIEQVLRSYGVPVSRETTQRLAATRLGAGLLAFLRSGLEEGTAADLVSWLRTPGKLPDADADADAGAVDELEALIRRRELGTAAQARDQWERRHGTLRELDALRAAMAPGHAEALLEVLGAELEAIWTAPHRRRAQVLDPGDEGDARVAAELRSALAELKSLAAVDPALAGTPAEIGQALADVEVRTSGTPGGVVLSDPLAVRARRFRAVFVCGLQDAEFPRRGTADPFLSDADRRELARASGIVLPLHEDALDAERHLFYAAVSRAQEVVFCSYRSSDEEGEPQVASPFVADLCALFDASLVRKRGRRLLADVTWPPAQAPTQLELRRAIARTTPGPEPAALAAPQAHEVLARLAARDCEPAAQLEAFAACGVRWLVESLLRPRRIEPDSEPMKRGSLAHKVLEQTLRGLRERTGSARLTPESRAEAERELAAVIAELARSAGGARARAGLRALGADLRRWLAHECECGPAMEPELLEWSFGGEDDQAPAADLGDGLRIRGRVDRVDVAGGTALVRDYKNSKGFAGARWVEDGRMQAALYALAVGAHLGLAPGGALYQPLSGEDIRARGFVAAGTPAAEGAGSVANDVIEPEQLAAVLEAIRELAAGTARDLRAGRIAPCAERCTPRGCAYPAICRAGDRRPADAPGAETS